MHTNLVTLNIAAAWTENYRDKLNSIFFVFSLLEWQKPRTKFQFVCNKIIQICNGSKDAFTKMSTGSIFIIFLCSKARMKQDWIFSYPPHLWHFPALLQPVLCTYRMTSFRTNTHSSFCSAAKCQDIDRNNMNSFDHSFKHLKENPKYMVLFELKIGSFAIHSK